MNKQMGIYKIENKINGMIYIGESLNIEKRWKEHLFDLNNNSHHSYKLQKDWNNYGKENFTFEVLEIIDELESIYKTKMQLIYIESNYINKYNSINIGYNIENTVDEVISGKKVIMNKDIDARYLKNLIVSKGKIEKRIIKDNMLNALPLAKFIDKLRCKYVINFSKSEFYYILQNRNIIEYKNRSYYLNKEFIDKGYFINGKQQKNAYGYIYYQILITELGEQLIINLLNLQNL